MSFFVYSKVKLVENLVNYEIVLLNLNNEGKRMLEWRIKKNEGKV